MHVKSTLQLHFRLRYPLGEMAVNHQASEQWIRHCFLYISVLAFP